MKVGDLVVFCKNPPEHRDHCNIWQWGVGILIASDHATSELKILYEGDVFSVASEWVVLFENSWMWKA